MGSSAEYKRRFKIAAYTEKWAVTMTKVRIRQALAAAPFPRWHLLTFAGLGGGESRGVVDLIAIRKDHGTPCSGTKRGDCFQIILIQVKGGYAARPTPDDAQRLRAVARRHCARAVLLATWKKSSSARFFALTRTGDWREVPNVKAVFQ
jgi:hypothetical protein